ncbi:MAG: hypothetical protein ACOYJB_04515 [Christensenellaceae bacterium]|jgi:hypothetical protein
MKASNQAQQKRECLKKLFSTIKQSNVEKAIVIENNLVHTYGYGRHNVGS